MQLLQTIKEKVTQRKMNNKGQNISQLVPFVVTIAAVALIGGIITLVLVNVDTQSTDNGLAQAIGNGTSAILNVTSNLPLIATIGALAVVAALAIGIFAARSFGK